MEQQAKTRQSSDLRRFVPDPDAAYISRCVRKLKAMGFPLDGWRCIEVVDVKEEDKDAPLETCSICGCSRVRYLHIMEHPDTGQNLSVGCICAGVMEGDIFGAKERERQMKNRAARRRSFIRKAWETGIFDGMLFQKKSIVYMQAVEPSAGLPSQYHVFVDDERVTEYKGKPICDPLTAKYAAFELLDPPDLLDLSESPGSSGSSDPRNPAEQTEEPNVHQKGEE